MIIRRIRERLARTQRLNVLRLKQLRIRVHFCGCMKHYQTVCVHSHSHVRVRGSYNSKKEVNYAFLYTLKRVGVGETLVG